MNQPQPRSASPDDSFQDVLAFLRQLVAERYFGRVELSFQSGHVVNIKKEESLKPADLTALVANSKGNPHVNNSR